MQLYSYSIMATNRATGQVEHKAGAVTAEDRPDLDKTAVEIVFDLALQDYARTFPAEAGWRMPPNPARIAMIPPDMVAHAETADPALVDQAQLYALLETYRDKLVEVSALAVTVIHERSAALTALAEVELRLEGLLGETQRAAIWEQIDARVAAERARQ